MTATIPLIERAAFAAAQAWGLSTFIDAHDCDAGLIRDRDSILRFTHQLCDLLEVKRFGQTQVVRFGDDARVYGYSMVQLIETSLVSAHFAEESDSVYLDIFSCKWYDPETAAAFTKRFFRAARLSLRTCLRK